MQDVWGDKKHHMFQIRIKNEFAKLFDNLWKDKEIPEECKLDLSYETWRAWGGPKTSCGIQIVRLPWFNIAIISTGEVISLNQLDDLIEAVNISNEELAKEVDKLRKEFEENPTTNSEGYGPILKYNTDKSFPTNDFISMAVPKEKKDCEK